MKIDHSPYIVDGALCIGPNEKPWTVTHVDQDADELQWVTVKNEVGATIKFPLRDAAKWLRPLTLLLIMLVASPAIAHQGDPDHPIPNTPVQQTQLPRTLTIVNPQYVPAPPYVIPNPSIPVQERPAPRRQPCARWIDEGCR